jgi:hypothetical protein
LLVKIIKYPFALIFTSKCVFHRLTVISVCLIKNFSSGALYISNEVEIEEQMRLQLTWNSAKIILETEFNSKYAGNDAERSDVKAKATSEINIKKKLSSNYKNFSKTYNIFEKLPHFAIFRLKVNIITIISYISKLVFLNHEC